MSWVILPQTVEFYGHTFNVRWCLWILAGCNLFQALDDALVSQTRCEKMIVLVRELVKQIDLVVNFILIKFSSFEERQVSAKMVQWCHRSNERMRRQKVNIVDIWRWCNMAHPLARRTPVIRYRYLLRPSPYRTVLHTNIAWKVNYFMRTSDICRKSS